MQDSLLQYFGESEITFDQFVIQTPSGRVSKNKDIVKLEPQVFAFLLLLIRRKDHIVTREEIVAEVWGDKKASDDAIRALVKKLRIALGDNARAPKFLKTVPLQGYLFIMPVEVEFQQVDWWRKKYVMYTASIVAAILITLLIQSQFGTFQSNDDTPKRNVIVSTMSKMTGSEVSPHLSKNDRLLYSHQGVNDTSLQLYAKSLNSAVSKRLTWDNADYVNGIFAPDARQAIVKRREGAEESLVLFNFDETNQLISADTLVLNEALGLQGMKAISYSKNSESVYLTAELIVNSAKLSTAGATALVVTPPSAASSTKRSKDPSADLSEQQANNAGLIRYNTVSKLSTIVPLVAPVGSEVIQAQESDDGGLLAVLVRGEGKTDLHIIKLDSQETKFVKRMPAQSNSFVWAPDGSSISFSTQAGELFNLNLVRQRLYQWAGLPVAISEVLSQCGEYCFIVKQKEADVFNVTERPVSVKHQPYMSSSQFLLQSNDRFPSYFDGGNGVYFLSLTDTALSLQRYVNDEGISLVYDLPKTSDIQSFVLSPDEKRFVGDLDGRLFVFDIGRRTLAFLPSTVNRSSNPVWSTNDTLLFQQIENINPVESSIESTVKSSVEHSVIREYDLVSGKLSVKAQGLLMLKPLNASQWLLVDEQYQAYLYTPAEVSAETKPAVPEAFVFSAEMLNSNTKFADLDSVNSNNVRVLNNSLYFISRANRLPILNTLDLETGVLESKTLGMQSVLSQLDIHPSTQKMLVVESSLAQSNLLKVEGLSLTTRQVSQVLNETP